MMTFTALLVSLVAGTVIAQTPGAPAPMPNGSLIDPALLEFVKVFGFGAMIFIVWWRDARKIDRLTRLAEDYEKLSANYAKLTEEARDSILMSVRVQTKLVEKLESMERRV